jgi:hypothetical protein
MKWYIWLQEEIDKAIKKRNLNEIIRYHNLFTRAFMDEHTDFSHIKELFITAKDLGYLKEEITKEDLDEYFDSENNNGIFIRWDEMLNKALDQYI